jgi:hypothetical protein
MNDTVTRAQVLTALNAAADAVNEAADLPEEGARDAINLVINLVGHWLFIDPDADVDEVIEASYEIEPHEVLDWCGR